MDDTQQQQQPTADQGAIPNMTDVAGMTPPPAPVSAEPTPTPSVDISSAANAMPAAPTGEAMDDASYAEEVLNEILDSLDRIEAKLEAMEKKMG